MPNVWFCSDLHLGHRNSIQFSRTDGTPLRPFESVEHMNAIIIANINSKVSPNDTLYIVGDATMPKSAIPLLASINGKKKLVMGNHDHKPELYTGIFSTVAAYLEFDGNVISHVPVHESQLERWKRNIHGHTHEHHLTIPGNAGVRDTRYYNVSIDAYAHGNPGEPGHHSGMNFYPKSYEDIKKELEL